jgi:ATP-dependent DNA helicase DinG
MPLHAYDKYFPYSKIRDEQRAAIEFAIDAYESGKKYVVLNMGTGCGKSATALTIARYMASHGEYTLDDEGMPLSGAYILTTQKILQQQYVSDFGPGIGPSKNLLLSIKSSNNYKCGYYPDQSCAESRRLLAQLGSRVSGTDFQKHCRGHCHYAKDKQNFIESPVSVTNFSYFFAETMYSKKLVPRDMLIIDECHNIESELGKFAEVTFSEKFAKEVLKCKIPTNLKSQSNVFDWVKKTYRPSLNKYIKDLEKTLLSKLTVDNSVGVAELSKQYEMLEKHSSKIETFIEIYSSDNWIVNILEPNEAQKRSQRKFEFKPVDIAKFSENQLFKFGGRILLLSATIVDKNIFCQSIGLDPENVSYLSIPSPFPVENRPIHYVPIGSMSIKNIDKSLPILANAIQYLLEQHPNEKGIIHCVNFKIAQYLIENVKSSRLVTHTSENREQVLNDHINSSDPTVLISPSMMEGVDLANDASRFQIMCKVPFPHLGDQVIKKRMENNRSWYTYQTIKSIIQAMGRSIRNENDYAVSYILDSDWDYFFRLNKSMFPEEFKNAIK